MQEQNFYEVLGVERSASRDTIRTAYRAMAKRYHPDAHPEHPEYEEVLKNITVAYAVLRDEIKRAKYDQGLSTGADISQSEPEDFWEPSADQLRDIYALDDDLRAKEIAHLCSLHPHLRQFFEDRPPPPRFKPSDAYVADFRLKDKTWRLDELERQCARHPHLQGWFADLEAQCQRAEEEQSRSIQGEQARVARYEHERMLVAGAAFGSLGGTIGLVVGFLPAWIIGGLVGVFSGGWAREVERNQKAFASEAGWFWTLWIGCGLVGAVLYFTAQLNERWLESKSKDLVWTRFKGLCIAVPCIFAIFIMVWLRASDMSQTANHLATLVQKKQSPIAVIEAKPLRIRSVTVDGLSLNANSFAAGNRAIANRFPLFTIEYEGAHLGDRISISLTRAQSETTRVGESRGYCLSDPLSSHGQWACRWDRSLEPGPYVFDVFVNGVYAAAYYFALAEPRQ